MLGCGNNPFSHKGQRRFLAAGISWLTIACLVFACSTETTGPNRRPVAIAGADQIVTPSNPITLDGRTSFDPDGNPLSFLWTFIEAPETPPEIARTGDTLMFTPTQIGIWQIGLTVLDGSLRSDLDVVTVRVIECRTNNDCQPDGVFCNGVEFCDEYGSCAHPGDPCVAQNKSCNETLGVCQGCQTNEQCEDNLSCTDDICRGSPGTCAFQPVNSRCPDDGVFCNGSEICDPNNANDPTGCVHSEDRCDAATPICLESEGVCVICTDDDKSRCDDHIDCTEDNCSGFACINVPNNNLCSTGGPCQVLQGTCDASQGCVFESIPAGGYCSGDTLTICNESGAIIESNTCALGCLDSGSQSRCRWVRPTNFHFDNASLNVICKTSQALTVTQSATIDTDTKAMVVDDVSVTPDSIYEIDQLETYRPHITVFSFHHVIINKNAKVTVTGTNALAIVSCWDITLDGQIDVSARMPAAHPNDLGGIGGPGGYNGGNNGAAWEDGLGIGFGHFGAENCNPEADSGGGGGSFGGKGGAGGTGTNYSGCEIAGGLAGLTYLDHFPGISPLIGGSGGGAGGDNNGGSGGGGGGAVQLVANGTISIGDQGGILAAGGGGFGGLDGCDSGAGGGGGSGGAILLEAPIIKVNGILAANGGGGGAGYKENYPEPNCARVSGVICPSGEPGQFGYAQAQGGPNGGDIGGAGGMGGAGANSTVDGEKGTDQHNGGGGGGGAGRIRINTDSSNPPEYSSSTTVISPSEQKDQCKDFCTEGNIVIW